MLITSISIDTTRCIGCGMCAYRANGIFLVVDRFSTVVRLPVNSEEVWRARDAADGCPVNAIRFNQP